MNPLNLIHTASPFTVMNLTRGIKIYPEYTPEQTKTFTQMWEDATAKIKVNPFSADRALFVVEEGVLFAAKGETKENEETKEIEIDETEKYSWVDIRLEEMYSHVEEEDDPHETFYHWAGNMLELIEPTYDWVDSRLEEMYSRIEEEDDEEKNNETFTFV